MDVNFFKSVEKKYNVTYPNTENATYSSILNFSSDLNKQFQRWCRYKEGYSVELVNLLVQKYNPSKDLYILDPFCGSGTTLLASNLLDYNSFGFEVNPFSNFLSNVKLDCYSKSDIDLFRQLYPNLLIKAENNPKDYILPSLSISNKVFDKNIEKYYMSLYEYIKMYKDINLKVYNLLKLGWLSCIEYASNYRKAGNGLKKRKYVHPRNLTIENVRCEIKNEYDMMYNDLINSSQNHKSVIYNDSCLNMRKYLKNGTFGGIIFSPPYANCFDYTEIYKLELWFGEFVNSYKDMKFLRTKSIRSHLNGNLSSHLTSKVPFLTSLLKELNIDNLWDKRIPNMLELYYQDMFDVLSICYDLLASNGFCSIIVGNSAYGNVVFPTDLILSEYATSIGFSVDVIDVNRFIITSSQQYANTINFKNYLRESIVCLKKK